MSKNDLSFNRVVLDYEALLETAEIAYFKTIAELKLLFEQLEKDMQTQNYIAQVITTERFGEVGKQLALTCSTFTTLKRGIDKEEKILFFEKE